MEHQHIHTLVVGYRRHQCKHRHRYLVVCNHQLGAGVKIRGIPVYQFLASHYTGNIGIAVCDSVIGEQQVSSKGVEYLVPYPAHIGECKLELGIVHCSAVERDFPGIVLHVGPKTCAFVINHEMHIFKLVSAGIQITADCVYLSIIGNCIIYSGAITAFLVSPACQ